MKNSVWKDVINKTKKLQVRLVRKHELTLLFKGEETKRQFRYSFFFHWCIIALGLCSFLLFFSVNQKAMAPHSSTLAWKIPWMEEPGGLQPMGSQRVGHN